MAVRYFKVNDTEFKIVPIDDFGANASGHVVFTDCILIVNKPHAYHEYALSFAEAYEEIANYAEVRREDVSI